jgi:hypothetical protein
MQFTEEEIEAVINGMADYPMKEHRLHGEKGKHWLLHDCPDAVAIVQGWMRDATRVELERRGKLFQITAFQRYVNSEIIPFVMERKYCSSISHSTARAWLNKLGYYAMQSVWCKVVNAKTAGSPKGRKRASSYNGSSRVDTTSGRQGVINEHHGMHSQEFDIASFFKYTPAESSICPPTPPIIMDSSSICADLQNVLKMQYEPQWSPIVYGLGSELFADQSSIVEEEQLFGRRRAYSMPGIQYQTFGFDLVSNLNTKDERNDERQFSSIQSLDKDFEKKLTTAEMMDVQEGIALDFSNIH